MRRILFTTAVGKIPDYYETIIKWKFLRPTLPVPSFGLRFLKANIPEIEILEYPDWGTFKKELKKGVDILGISFFMREAPVVKRMIEYARSVGIKQIWGGNYGILCDDIKSLFDKAFVGYAENQVSKALTGKEVLSIKHPSLISVSIIKKPYFPYKTRWGYIFTSRGCNVGCSFCQTPCFAPQISSIPIESIEAILQEYTRNVDSLFIMDENFLIDRHHATEVINLLHKYNIKWGCMTRPDLLSRKVKDLRNKGFRFCIIGLESFRQENLDFFRKREKASDILSTVKELRENKIVIQGTYIIGFPNDTEKTIEEDIRNLSSLDIQACQIFILTPLPHTQLWDYIDSKYVIFEKDYSKFDCLNLVWNHPHINSERMNKLLEWTHKTFYSRKKYIKRLGGLLRQAIETR